MLPEGWKRTTFENHIDLLSGNPFKSSEYSNDPADIRLLRGDNIEPGKLRWRDVKRWSVDQTHNLDRYYLQVGDFVIAMDRTWVSAGLKVTEVRSTDLPCLLVQRVSRIRALPTLCQSLIKQYFSSYAFENYVKSVETETAVPHISGQQIKDFPLLLPPLPEQKKIAAILSTWDRAIEVTEKLLANSQQQKKALMQQLLTGKKRLPGFTGEWINRSISQLGDINPQSPCLPTGTLVSFVSMDGVSNDARICDIQEREHKSGLDGFSSFIEGDILIAKITPCFENGKGGYVTFLPHNYGFGSTEFYVIRAKKDVSGKFVYYCTTTSRFRTLGEMHMQGSAGQKRVPKDFLARLSLKIPSLREQYAIVEVLEISDKEITLLKSDLSRLRQEKKALMQQLLTGKRRVKIEADAG